MNPIGVKTPDSGDGNVGDLNWRRVGMMLALIAALMAFGFKQWHALLETLGKIDATSIAIAGITVGLQWFVGAWRDLLLVRRLTVMPISATRVMTLNSQQYLFNLLPLAMGTVLKAKRYREEMDVSYTQFGSMFLVQYAVLICVSTAWGVIAAIWLGHFRLAVSFFVIFAFTVTCLTVPKRIAQWSPRFAKHKLLEMHHGISLMISRGRSFLSVILLGVICHGLQCVRLYVLLHCLDPSIAFGDSLLYAAMAHLSLLLMVTPSGLGVREILFAVIASAANHSVVATVLAALVERVLAIGLALGVIIVSWMVSYRANATVSPTASEVETR